MQQCPFWLGEDHGPRGGPEEGKATSSSLLRQSVPFRVWAFKSYYLSFMIEKLGFLHNFFEDRAPFRRLCDEGVKLRGFRIQTFGAVDSGFE